MKARKLTAPTGRPVKVHLPTGGSKVTAIERDPEDEDTRVYAAGVGRKSTKGGKANVTSRDVIGAGPSRKGVPPRLAAWADGLHDDEASR